jgi:hypothetical protein
MGEAQRNDDVAAERLTWAEICARYPDEWLTLADMTWLDEEASQLDRAVVLAHSADYDASWPEPERPGIDELFHVFTGRVRGFVSILPL